MSLILDALRKADAERERGSVPKLHSQPVVASVAAPAKPATRPNWVWIVIGVALGLVAAALLVMIGRDAPAPKTATSAPPAQPSMLEPTPVRPTPISVAPPLPAASTSAQAIAEPAPWPQPADRSPSRAEAKGDRQVVVLGNVPPAEPTVYSRERLPADIRGALPQIAVGGSVYSPDPTARSLIINGQLYRERDRLTQELSLEEIKLKSAIFSFRGYRFEVVF